MVGRWRETAVFRRGAVEAAEVARQLGIALRDRQVRGARNCACGPCGRNCFLFGAKPEILAIIHWKNPR